MSQELNTREKAIMYEAFMMGRVYSAGGEKESIGDMIDKLERVCTATAERAEAAKKDLDAFVEKA